MPASTYETETAKKVSVYPISQATTATFTELYFRLTFLFFIQQGSKYVLDTNQGELLGQQGDLMIFPPGSMVTMENRPVMNGDYRALGVSFSHDLIAAVFADLPKTNANTGIQIVRTAENKPADILHLITETLNNDDLPDPIREHRLLEPLLWLRAKGVILPCQIKDSPVSQIRQFIETDIAHPWTANEVAQHFAMSEATMRRWLGKSGQGYAKILLNTRLEHDLSQLQISDLPISTIALDCGFKTPSHFSDAFRKRFGIKPKDIRENIRFSPN